MKKFKITNTLPMIPLRDMVIFPHMVIPLFVGRPKSMKAVFKASNEDTELVLVTQKKADVNNPVIADIFDIGVAVEIQQLMRLPDGTIKVLVEGIRIVKIESYVEEDNIFSVIVSDIESVESPSAEIDIAIGLLKESFEKFVKLNQNISPELIECIREIEAPNRLVDSIAAHLTVPSTEKQAILEGTNPFDRLLKLNELIESEIAIMKVEKKVKGRVKRQIEKNQKEYYLQEQIKAIQKELGGKDESISENEELKAKIEKVNMPKDVHKRAMKELKRLEQMQPMSAEGTVVRNYLDWLIDMPWKVRSKEKLSISEAIKILDRDHHGLKKVKERIIEYLSVKSLVKVMKGPILCLAGPPGVGKTSLGKSIANATGREFVRISLGGVRDEAEIRGHRRTYIGALPGRIIQSLKKVGTKNPVFMLDEMDKMSSDFRGDPASAMLEVLDPEQNNTFNDHFLEVDFDLSEVMFIATANVTHTIPKPLLDRMEVIRMEGYTEEEKIKIASQFLVPKNLTSHGFQKEQVAFSDPLLKKIIQDYTRESGVRNLDREVAHVCRKMARKLVESSQKKKKFQPNLNQATIEKVLGPRKFTRMDREKKSEIGLANGLAWTEVGGETLLIEVMVLPGKGSLTLTGKLGDVMKESASAALGFVRSRYREMGLSKNFYNKIDIHIHLPEGAIPKDGPSAGISMATAIVSALVQRPIKNTVAMTGEITLRGKVLQIGGVKDKILAAHRAGISELILPVENKKDIKEVSSSILKSFTIHYVETLDEVLNIALEDQEGSFPAVEENEKFLPNTERPAPLPLN